MAGPSPRSLSAPLERAFAAWLERSRKTVLEAQAELSPEADLVVIPVVAAPSADVPAGQEALLDGGRAGRPARPAAGGTRLVPLSPLRSLGDERTLVRRRFSAALGETLVVTPADPSKPVEMLVGLGPEGSWSADAFRQAGAAVARQVGAARYVAVDLHGLSLAPSVADPQTSVAPAALLVQAFAEGFELASYHYDGYPSSAHPSSHGRRSGAAGARRAGSPAGEDVAAPTSADSEERDRWPERVVVVCDESGAAELGVERATVVASAVYLARDLGNTPAADCTPLDMVEMARRIAESEGLSLEVIDAEAAAREGLGGLLGVARGSSEPPALVRLGFEPELDAPPAGRATLALVGKGITFDSGGLSLKDPGPMMAMKTDMSGAAAVLAALSTCRRLGVDKRVVGLMPLTENMPGERATKPGDVLRIRNGTTVEVLNTDAEGRLVLADALSLAVELEPDAIVDLATLTGACVVALGKSVAGLMGSDGRLVSAVEAAAARAGEAVWQLPLPVAYRSQLDSEVADLKNIGKSGEGGALVAGLFLREFVADVPWAHLDIAGPSRSDEESGYLQKGSTGFGVRTLVELLHGALRRRAGPA